MRGLPSRAVGWAEVAAAAHAGRVPGETPDLEDTHVFEVSQSSFANGTHAVVLEVDPETGAVEILRWIVAHDCGHVLEPGIVDGQIHGGVVQGLPDALNLQLAYDDNWPAPHRDPDGLRARHRRRCAAAPSRSATSSRPRR